MFRKKTILSFLVLAIAAIAFAGFAGTAMADSGNAASKPTYQVKTEVFPPVHGVTNCVNTLQISYDGGITFTTLGVYSGGLLLVVQDGALLHQTCVNHLDPLSGPGVDHILKVNTPYGLNMFTPAGVNILTFTFAGGGV